MMNQYPVSRADCDICQKLPYSLTVTYPCAGQAEEVPEGIKRLRSVSALLKCCLRCGTYYRVEHEQDHDHYYPDSYDIFTRLGPAEALQLITASGDQAEKERLLAVYNSQMEELKKFFATKPNKNRFELSQSLCWHYAQREEWSEVETLVRSQEVDVRLGAFQALQSVGLRKAPGSAVAAVAESTPATGTDWYRALGGLSGSTLFTYAVPGLIAALDAQNEFVRGQAVALLKDCIKNTAASTTPNSLKEHIPMLVAHLASPKDAVFPYYPSDGNTEQAASMLLTWLAHTKENAVLIHKEMKKQGVHIPKEEGEGPKKQIETPSPSVQSVLDKLASKIKNFWK